MICRTSTISSLEWVGKIVQIQFLRSYEIIKVWLILLDSLVPVVDTYVIFLNSKKNSSDHHSALFPDDFLPTSLPRCSSLKNLLFNYLDMTSVPRRSFFDLCRQYASDERELEKLEEFCSIEGQVSVK